MSYLIEQQEKANKNLERVGTESRLEDRALWDKLLTVVLGILGFSLTLFSTDELSSKIIDSCSKYFLLFTWVCYGLSLFIGFFLLKTETGFQRKASLRNTLYAMDTSELLDDKTLQVKEGKKEYFVALQVLHSKNLDSNNMWSKTALEMYERHKKELNSYKLAGDPQKLYAIKDHLVIIWSEKIFYSLIIIATISLIASVAMVII